MTSDSEPDCIAGTSICLVAYSAFGDPVGASGAVDNLTLGGSAKDFNSFAQFGGSQSAGGNCIQGLICGLNFGETTLAIPTFDGTSVNFQDRRGSGTGDLDVADRRLWPSGSGVAAAARPRL